MPAPRPPPDTDALARFVLQNVSDFAVLSTDLAGVITSWNPGAEKLLGWPAAEALGRHGSMIFTPEDRARGRSEAEMAAAREAGRTEDERWHVRRDASVFWASGLLMRAEDEATGEHVGYVKVLRDRTPQHQAEERTRASEHRLRLILDSTADGIYGVDRDGVTTFCNAAFLQMLGFAREEDAVGRKLHDLIHHSHPDGSVYHAADCPIQRAARAGTEAHVSGELFFRVDGTSFPVEYWVRPFAPGGHAGGAVCTFVDLTRRQAAETALRSSEARLRAIVSTVPVGIVLADAGGRIYDGNARAEEIFGHPVLHSPDPESYGDWVSFHPDGRRVQPQDYPLTRALAGEEQPELEVQYQRGDGRRAWVRLVACPIRDGSGRPDGALVAALDVDAERRAEAELRRLNESLEREVAERTAERDRIWQVSRDLLGVADDRGVWLSVNPAWTTLLGWDADEIVGHTSEWLEHPGDRDRTRAEVARLAEGQATLAFENRFRGKDGRFHDLAWTATPAEGRLYCVARDVTEEKKRAAALRLYSDIVASDPSPVCAFDLHGRMTGLNQAHSNEFSRMFNHRPVLGERVTEVLPPGQAASIQALMARALAGETFTVTGPLGDPARARSSYEAAYTPLRDDAGRIVGGFIHARDVTARLQAQADLEHAQDALRQAQKMEAVGQLTGGVAHDFNNLLTIIRSSVELLRRPGLPEERRRRYIDAIAETVDRAARLTGQLLAFARRQALKPEVFDAAERVWSVGDMLRTIVGSRIRMEQEGPREGCFIRADASQFETAIVNMAVNARDAMDGEGTLTVRVEAVSHLPPIRDEAGSPGPFVAISLADTGSGIAPDALPRIFEPFFTTKEVGRGTGLGLSQVYGFARQSGGDVDVRSELGHGTIFTLYLRQVQPEAAAVAGVRPEAAVEGRGCRVLLVEDNAEVGRFSTQLLQDLGYETVWAANAGEALHHLDAGGRFDVVFSDVVMPGMNGVDLGREILRRFPGLPVVLTSGYSAVLAAEGTHGFPLLHKPYAAAELAGALRTATAASRAVS